ncbi:putative cyclase [Gloeopeniophorella convolvens]|nr:putative cyclase [Gloeopeniophorella convolvens]
MSAPACKKVIDLSHPLAQNGLSYCSGHPHFRSEQVLSLAADSSNVSRLTLGSHTGTHLDAPVHFIAGAPTISDVDLSLLVGPAIVLDVRGKAPHSTISWADLAPQAEQHAWPGAAIALLCTGWSRHWGGDAYMTSPRLGADAARGLLARGVRVVGMDVFSVDGGAPANDVHRLLLGSGALIAENLTNVEALLGGGTRYMASLLPLNLAGCDGSPVRAVAWGV